jgi:serine/threonine-protein kinase
MMTFDAEPTAAVRAATAFFHGSDGVAESPSPEPDRRLDGLLPPGGALAGRVFSRLLGEAHDDPPLAPGTRVGAWRIGGMLGCGGSAIVYLADRADGHFDQQSALKVLRPRPELIERFRRERQILAGLRHPAIARLIDGGEIEGGRLWFAMEPVFGERIDDYVRTRKLSLEERLVLFEAVCEAVAYAHRRKLVHRDIKPANVLVDEAGKPRLLDFGIATSDDEREQRDRAMTPNYASPEQRDGSTVTPASDIYQLGAMLRELVAGCPSMSRRTTRGIDAIVTQATRDDPGCRYGRVAVLWSDVVALRERRDVSVLPSWRQRTLRFLELRMPRVAIAAREFAAVVVVR